MTAKYRRTALADLEQRNGRAVRQGTTPIIAQIFFYFAVGAKDDDLLRLHDAAPGEQEPQKEPRDR